MWFIWELDGGLSKESKEHHIIILLQIWYCVNLNNSTKFPLCLWPPQAWFSLCALGLKSRGQLVTPINRHATISQVGTFWPADWFCSSQALQLGKTIAAFASAAACISFSSHLKASCREEDFPSVLACFLYIFDVWWGRGDRGYSMWKIKSKAAARINFQTWECMSFLFSWFQLSKSPLQDQ